MPTLGLSLLLARWGTSGTTLGRPCPRPRGLICPIRLRLGRRGCWWKSTAMPAGSTVLRAHRTAPGVRPASPGLTTTVRGWARVLAPETTGCFSPFSRRPLRSAWPPSPWLLLPSWRVWRRTRSRWGVRRKRMLSASRWPFTSLLSSSPSARSWDSTCTWWSSGAQLQSTSRRQRPRPPPSCARATPLRPLLWSPVFVRGACVSLERFGARTRFILTPWVSLMILNGYLPTLRLLAPAATATP